MWPWWFTCTNIYYHQILNIWYFPRYLRHPKLPETNFIYFCWFPTRIHQYSFQPSRRWNESCFKKWWHAATLPRILVIDEMKYLCWLFPIWIWRWNQGSKSSNEYDRMRTLSLVCSIFKYNQIYQKGVPKASSVVIRIVMDFVSKYPLKILH